MRRIVAVLGSAIFFVVAPGIVAGYLPWRICGWHVRTPLLGISSFRVEVSYCRPENWQRIPEAVKEHGVDETLMPTDLQGGKSDLSNPKLGISLVVARKAERQGPEQSLSASLDAYQSEYPGIRFEDWQAGGSEYAVLTKLAEDSEHQFYLAYIDPGPKARVYIACLLYKLGAPVTTKELNSYRRFVGSIRVADSSDK